MSDQSLDDTYKQILTEIAGPKWPAPPWGVNGDYVQWLTDAAIIASNIVGEQQVAFTAAQPLTDDGDGMVLVFTDAVVIRVVIQRNSEAPGRLITSATVTSRSDLQSLVIRHERGTQPGLGVWYEGQTVALHYSDGDVITLPFEPSWNAVRANLVDLLPSLVADLSA